MFRYASIAMSVAFWIATMGVSSAQIVRVDSFGGTSVRIPLLGVSVDVMPYGQGTRVRAPFTSVDTGLYNSGYRSSPSARYDNAPGYAVPFYAPQYDAATTPTTDAQLPGVPSASLDQDLLDAALRLRTAISMRRDDADIWLQYLKPDDIIAAVNDRRAPQSLRNLLMNYDGILGNPQLTGIRSIDGFNETRQLLRQWVDRNLADADVGDSKPDYEVLPAPARARL